MSSKLAFFATFVLGASAITAVNDKKPHEVTTTTTKTVTKTVVSQPTCTTPAFQSFYIDEYDLLYFNLINLVDDTLSQLGVNILAGGTAPNTAAFGPTVLDDPTALVNPPVQITSRYLESSITSFSPYSWLYGCTLGIPESDVNVPVACTITAQGFTSNNKLVATQSFSFNPPALATTANFAVGYFSSSFNNVQYMNLTVSNNDTTACVFDNFIAELFQKPSIVFYPSPVKAPAS